MRKILQMLALAMILFMPIASALDFNQTISDQDRARFDAILSPVMKIYTFIKYAATVIAVILLVFAGIIFITNGGDVAKREQAKMMIMYIVIGLIVIWVAPLIVQLVTG
jgi:hypothetical protein